MDKRLRIVFMGTPAFAIPALTALIEEGHDIIAAYTQPPRPANRGQKLSPSPVQLLATKNNIPVFVPRNFKQESDREQFRELNTDIVVVAAYGLLLPPAILEAPKHGCINIHPSLLPRWRGAAPIQRTLMAGDSETAVCIMQMNEGLDTGDILLCEYVEIAPEMNAGDLHDTLSQIGADLLLKAIKDISAGRANAKSQAEEGATYALKITKEEARIDWKRPSQEILWQVRGLSPAPGAYGLYQDISLKILKAEPADIYAPGAVPGEVLDDRLAIATGQGVLRPTFVQRPGKRPMPTEELLRGQPIPIGAKFL